MQIKSCNIQNFGNVINVKYAVLCLLNIRRRCCLLYNTLRVDGSNVCITKMRPMPSLTH